MSTKPDPADLRDSVRDYRNPNTTEAERADIRAYWAQHGIKTQFGAVARAYDIEHATEG